LQAITCKPFFIL